MSIEKPILKLYNTDFTLVALIDDYQQAQIEHNLYSAGAFSISINYNIPNAKLFERGLFLQFGNNARDFCVIQSVENSIGSSGKGSEYITVSGYDCRYLFKRRIIKNLNSNDTWSMTAKGELCIRSLVADQCGVNAEEKRKLPITNIIPNDADALGGTYSVSEAYSNLYDTLVTIATQSEIGWAVEFNGSSLNLVVYQGENKSNNVFFSTDFESLANGKYKDSNDSYSNSVYIGGKGTGSERDIYEGEVDEPEGLERFESYDNQSSMTTEEEYEEKARSILSQYGQTITVSGAGLAKCPYVFREQYDIGDIIKLSFSGKSANTQILSVSESWAKGSYSLSFNFGKPVNTLSDQLSIILRKIQDASNKSSSATSVKWYTLPDDTEQDISDVTFDTLGFTGEIASGGSTFTLGFNSEGVGCKTYIIYIKNLTGSDELTLTTGTDGAENITFNQGTYIAAVTVDTEGNVIAQSVTEATHAQNADRASKDSAGNVITTTYATKTEVPTNNNQLTNGAGYITSSGSITGNAATANNADMVDGYHASESAQAHTVGARDASGFFNAVIFHDTWGEENINSYSSPKIMFKGNNDGYIRNTDPSNVKVGAATTADWATNQAFYGQTIDCSSLDQNTWYPCVLNLDITLPTQIYCCTALDNRSHPSWATHPNGFTSILHFDALAGGWGAAGGLEICLYDDQRFYTGGAPVGYTFSNDSSWFIFYLRGGGVYNLANNRGQLFTLYSSGVTDADGTVYSPRTTRPTDIVRAYVIANLNGNADSADKIRTSAPSSPSAGDIWIS